MSKEDEEHRLYFHRSAKPRPKPSDRPQKCPGVLGEAEVLNLICEEGNTYITIISKDYSEQNSHTQSEGLGVISLDDFILSTQVSIHSGLP